MLDLDSETLIQKIHGIFCNIYLAGIQMDFEVFTMVPMWVLVHPRMAGWEDGLRFIIGSSPKNKTIRHQCKI
jgi:hypothetical protein